MSKKVSVQVKKGKWNYKIDLLDIKTVYSIKKKNTPRLPKFSETPIMGEKKYSE